MSEELRLNKLKERRDFQTFSLFIILGLLTLLFVTGLRLVLFGPTAPKMGPTVQLTEDAAK